MSTTGSNGSNGSQATPSRDEVVYLSAYYAAVSGNYDTSESAQKMNLLTITIMDMTTIPGEVLRPGTTHQMYVIVNETGYLVTCFRDGSYVSEPHDHTPEQRQERALREAVLDAGLWQLTGEGAGYHVDAGPRARADAINTLLADQPEDPKEREEHNPDPVDHPIVRDELPDLTISLAPGAEGGIGPRVLRQWTVQIGGPWNSCEVGLFGYEADGTPVLIPMDREPGEEGNDEEDEED